MTTKVFSGIIVNVKTELVPFWQKTVRIKDLSKKNMFGYVIMVEMFH